MKPEKFNCKQCGKEISRHNQHCHDSMCDDCFFDEHFPEYKDWVDLTVKRIVDLLLPFRSFHYHHPKQKGSASIKKVLPVVTGKSYDSMEIGEGGTASLRYLYITHNKEATEKEKREVRANLEEYCKLDTEEMVWIVEELGVL